MNSEILNIFKDSGAMLEGHFLLTSGRHSDKYMQCARLFENYKYSELAAKDIAQAFKDDKIDIVAGPALGGIILAYEVSRQMNIRNIFAERDNKGNMALRRGFNINKGDRVLITENVITTGGSVVEVMDVLKKAGADIAGVALVVDRTNGMIDFGVKTHAVLSMEVISWEKEDCPLCKKDMPIDKPGSRKIK